MREILMCDYYYVACVADEDECGTCGKPQYECGNAVTWIQFARMCPNRWDTTNECHHGHFGIMISTFKCTDDACPRLRLIKAREHFMFNEIG